MVASPCSQVTSAAPGLARATRQGRLRRVQTGHGPALSGEQQREGAGAAPDVEDPVGAQLRDQPDVRRQVVAVAVEDVVQAGQAGIGEEGVGHRPHASRTGRARRFRGPREMQRPGRC